MKNNHNLKYNWEKHPNLKWGFNDLNNDGIPDTLLTVWNKKTVVFVSDDGKLPWSIEDEGRDWDEYFNKAFNVGQEPPDMWNEIRKNWGNYTILIDRDECGRFDSLGDFYYKTLDLNGDGYPEAEYYNNLFPEKRNWSNKLHFNLNGKLNMSYLDWKNFYYPKGHGEQRYLAGNQYIMNVAGNGFFLNSYSKKTQNGWEHPIAWYDFDFDGHTNMVMRAADTHKIKESEKSFSYRGDLSEFEISFELNGNTGPDKFHSLDMQLTFYQYDGIGPSYQEYVDHISLIKGLKEAAFLSEELLSTRQEPIRRYIPYMDGFKHATEFKGWAGVWMIFDEDDDDNRWEEMFSRYEPAKWGQYSDRIGDRTEIDSDYGGKGKLYIGKFDRRLHLYHSEKAIWDIDYLALYKGAVDREDTDEGPEPPIGLRYPQVRYSDTNGNGFIDKIEYLTVEYGRESETEKIERVILLSDYIEDENSPDICDLIEIRGEAKLNGWKVENWNVQPLKPKDFEGTPNKEIYDKMVTLYTKVADDMWNNAQKLYQVAKKHNLNISENKDKNIKTAYTKDELKNLKEITVPEGYSRHLSGKTRREKYHNGFWLKEKIFKDIIEHSGLDKFTLEKYYYTGNIDKLCEYIENEKNKPQRPQRPELS
jgi:hypothetical protein